MSNYVGLSSFTSTYKLFFPDPWQHLVADTETEKKYNFQLRKVLTECKHRHMLEKYSVYITPSVRLPSIPEVRGMYALTLKLS